MLIRLLLLPIFILPEESKAMAFPTSKKLELSSFGVLKVTDSPIRM
jgi:hypothetical protein